MSSAARSIRRLLIVAALALLGSAGGPALAGQAEPERLPSGAKPDSSQEAIRQVGIMAKVMEWNLLQRFGTLVAMNDAFQSGGVRGYRISEFGAVFVAHVKFSLAEGKPAAKPAKSWEDSQWDLLDKQSRGFDAAWQSSIQVTEENRQRAEFVQQVVAQTLAKYGHRLAALEPNESIVVIVGSSPDDAMLAGSTFAADPFGQPYAYYGASPESLPASSWILAVKKSDLANDPEKLTERAKIRRTQLGAPEEAKTVKQMTIMSRILEADLGKAFPGEILTANMLQRGSWGSR